MAKLIKELHFFFYYLMILVKLQEAFVKENAIELLWKFVERFHETNSKTAVSCIGGIGSLIDESGTMENYSNHFGQST